MINQVKRHLTTGFQLSQLLLICALVGFTGIASSAQTRTKEDAKTVIFAVSSSYHPSIDQSRPHLGIEPIVIIDGGNYKKPPQEKEEDEVLSFGESYYRSGLVYHLLFGGGRVGQVTVKQWVKPDPYECFSNSALVRMKTALKFGNNRALATNSKTLGRKNSLRRAPTPQEHDQILKIAEEAFRSKGAPIKSLQELWVSGLAVSDLNGDGVFEMIGSFQIKDKPDHSLFLIAERRDTGYEPSSVWYHFDSGPSSQVRSFIDHLDLDGDGVDEVITKDSFSQATRYQIYKKKEGQWQVIYEGGGISC